MKKIGAIGAGSWGTALQVTLAKKGHQVKVFDADKEHLESLKANRENLKYLPGVKIPDGVTYVDSTEEALTDVDIVLFAIPTQVFRKALDGARQYIKDDHIVVNVAKGIEQKTLKRMSEIAAEQGIVDNYCVLSGPSHAEEVGIGLLTTVVSTSVNPEVAKEIQEVFATDYLRVYTGDDLVGVELGGALKNIIALGAGITDGMGYGDNTKAALMTRGLTEIQRLGVALGAKPETFAGLTGVGDLIVTCTSMHSRNRRCGIMIGEGMDPQEATKKVGMVVEGMFTTEAAYDLAKKVGVEMPITSVIYDTINGKKGVKESVASLMARELKPEIVK